MPHLIIEYSANIATTARRQAVTLGHQIMRDSGLFDVNAIKTRSHETADYEVGAQGIEGSFMHALVYLMEGRSSEQKKALAQSLFQALDPLMPKGASLTVDVRELDKAVYQKRTS